MAPTEQPRSSLPLVVGVAAIILLLLGAAALWLSRRGSEADPVANATPSPPAGICENRIPSYARAKFLREEAYPMTIVPGDSYSARMNTSCGYLEIELFASRSPNAVNNFEHLAKAGWYNATAFQSEPPGLIRAGSPSGDADSGPGYTIPDDDEKPLPYEVGSLIMWHTDGPDSAGSQFVIVTEDAAIAGLPQGMTVFGQLRDEASLEVARTIASIPADSPNPDEQVWILGVKVSHAEGTP